MPPAKLARLRMSKWSVGTEHMLPLPRSVRSDQLPAQRMGKIHPSESFAHVVLPNHSAAGQMRFQSTPQGRRQRDLTILVALPAADGEYAPHQVDVLRAQIQQFTQSQAAAILHPEEQIPRIAASRKKFPHRGRGEDDGKTPRMMGVPFVRQDQIEPQHSLHQPSQGVASQGQRTCRQVLLMHQAVQKLLHLTGSLRSILWNRRMALGKTTRPVEISRDRVFAVVPNAQTSVEVLQDLGPRPSPRGWFRRHHGKPDLHSLIRLAALPLRNPLLLQNPGKNLGRLHHRRSGQTHRQPALYPTLVINPVVCRNTSTLQSLAIVRPHLSVDHLTRLYAQRGIPHNTKIYAQTGSRQGLSSPQTSNTPPRATPSTRKPEFCIRKMLGTPPGGIVM